MIRIIKQITNRIIKQLVFFLKKTYNKIIKDFATFLIRGGNIVHKL